jgi:hypothetical protein
VRFTDRAETMTGTIVIDGVVARRSGIEYAAF